MYLIYEVLSLLTIMLCDICLLQDSDNGVMEGYLDELGRAWCGNGSSLKYILLLTHNIPFT